MANYTYVSSETTFEFEDQTLTAPLNGLSEDSYNATLYYEDDRWGARISVNDRSDYTTGVPGGNGNLTEGTSGLPHYDFSSFFNLTDNIVLTLHNRLGATSAYVRRDFETPAVLAGVPS